MNNESNMNSPIYVLFLFSFTFLVVQFFCFWFMVSIITPIKLYKQVWGKSHPMHQPQGMASNKIRGNKKIQQESKLYGSLILQDLHNNFSPCVGGTNDLSSTDWGNCRQTKMWFKLIRLLFTFTEGSILYMIIGDLRTSLMLNI